MPGELFKKLYYISIILIFAVVSFFLFKKLNILDYVNQVNVLDLSVIVFVSIIAIYLNGVFLKIMAGVFGINLKEHFLISISTSFLSLIIPFRGGLAARAVFMKKKYGYSYANFAASIFGNYVVLFLVASVLAIVLLILMYFIYGIFNLWFILVFCGLFCGMLMLVFLKINFKSKNFFVQKINKVINGWKLIAVKPLVIAKLAINTLLTFLIQALAVKFAFSGIGLEIPFLKALFMAVMNLLGAFINITPGSLGLTEALYVISGTGLGIVPGVSLLVALIIRAVNTVVLLVLGPLANYLLLKKV